MSDTALRARQIVEAGAIGGGTCDANCDARMLAMRAKTLHSIAARDGRRKPKAGRRKKTIVDDDDHQDRIPADIDGLRRELARQLEAMAT
jgi:hypothetical protein